MQVLSFPTIWVHDQHFRIEKNDDKRAIFDYGVMADFDQERCASSKDTNLIHGTLKYLEKF